MYNGEFVLSNVAFLTASLPSSLSWHWQSDAQTIHWKHVEVLCESCCSIGLAQSFHNLIDDLQYCNLRLWGFDSHHVLKESYVAVQLHHDSIECD